MNSVTQERIAVEDFTEDITLLRAILKSGGSPLYYWGGVMSVRRRRENHTTSSYHNSEDYFPFHRQLITFRHFSLCRQFTEEEVITAALTKGSPALSMFILSW